VRALERNKDIEERMTSMQDTARDLEGVINTKWQQIAGRE
jgi:hypothetical protein